MRRRSSCASGAPSWRSRPSREAIWRAAGSRRVIRPCASKAIRRAPTSIAMSSATRPSRQIAALVVPPPMSRFITGPSVSDRLTAPEQRAGVDLFAGQPSGAVLAVDELAEQVAVDCARAAVGCQEDLRLLHYVAL